MNSGMGQTFELEPSNGTKPQERPRVADNEVAMILGFQQELDEARAQVASFGELDSAEVLGMISGIAGRIGEIRAHLYRMNTQRCAALRTREVDPLREDLELQFKVWSRRIAVLEFDWKISGGGT